nr:hypothetical protein [Herbaspirillum sp. B39]
MTFALPVFFIGAIYHAACALRSRGRAAVRQERLADPKKVLWAQAVSGRNNKKNGLRHIAAARKYNREEV